MREVQVLIFVLVTVAIGLAVAFFPELAAGGLAMAALTFIGIVVFRRYTQEKRLVTGLFLGALAIRLAAGILIHVYDLRTFFGSDALFYDQSGAMLVDLWTGEITYSSNEYLRIASTTGSGWGMNYFVGIIYFCLGRNILVAQSICAVISSATIPLVYFCAEKIFHNKRVSKYSAISVTIFPAMVIWSSQLLKDGLIMFLLVLAMIMVMRLQENFDYIALAVLGLSLFGILSLRFYIFYMLIVAVVGSFVVGNSRSNQSIMRRTIALLLLGLGLTYFGVIRNANINLEKYGSLERIERSREDLSSSAKSGYGGDLNVSTSSGALTAIPTGFVYLVLAPFPWTVASIRQAIVIPEIVLWWVFLPIIGWGLWYTIRHRLRNAFPILLFTGMLTLAYSIFQGNVGTAYRQRTQIQVFLFIFFAVGVSIIMEKRQDKKDLVRMRQRSVGGGSRPVATSNFN